MAAYNLRFFLVTDISLGSVVGAEDVTMMTGEEINAFDAYLVFLNGLIVGVHTKPAQLVEKVRQLRRGGRIGEFVSVYLNEVQRAVYIASDGGRVCRPLLVLEAGTSVLLVVRYNIIVSSRNISLFFPHRVIFGTYLK